MRQWKRTCNKLISVLLVLVMAIQVFPMPVSAEQGISWNVPDGNAVAGEAFDLLTGVTATAEDGSVLTVKVSDVASADAAYVWNGTDTVVTPEAAGEYQVTYHALNSEDGIAADTCIRTVIVDSAVATGSGVDPAVGTGSGVDAAEEEEVTKKGLPNGQDDGTAEGPTIIVKLNGTTITDLSSAIAVKDGDELEVRVDFSEESAGNSYIIDLPNIFLRLSQEVLKAGNANLMNYADISLVQNIANTQQIKIDFKGGVLAASFSFVGTLNITSSTDLTERVIEVPGGGTITIKPEYTPSSSVGTGIGGRPSLPVLTQTGFFLKEASGTTITEKQFVEDKTIGNAFSYYLRLNRGQLTNDLMDGLGVTLNGTIRDELPTGMQLFIPGAPNSGYSGDYVNAYLSFDLYYIKTLIEEDNNGVFMTVTSSATIANIVKYVNRIENDQNRAAVYTTANLNARLNISSSLADYINNGDDVYVAYSSLYVGYKIIDGTIRLYAINTYTGETGAGEPYEEQRSEAWSDTTNTKCIPVYDTEGGKPGTVLNMAVYSSTYIQTKGSTSAGGGFTRTYLGATPIEGGTKYQWAYKYNDVTELILSVTSMSNGSDIVEVQTFAGDSKHFLNGRYITVRPYIYFDQSKWSIPSEGEIKFNNIATYNNLEKSVSSKYTYNFGSSGAAVTGANKTVDGKEMTYLNPEDANTKQTYAISFRKSGVLDIAAGSLNISDILDSHLDYVPGSIKIYKETAADVWEDVTASINDSSAKTTGDDLNLKVEYADSSHRIGITNIGELAFVGQIKIEFDVELKDDVKYGTLVTNYFGGVTVKTYVDHKLTVNKVDENNDAIKTGAVFSVEYTTAGNYKDDTLKPLTDTDGNPVTSLTTGTEGTAGVLYRLDADEFYIKLTETDPPENYIGISQPIWIKAVRNSVTKEMQYTLEEELDGVSINVSAKGEVTLTVSNTIELNNSLTIYKVDSAHTNEDDSPIPIEGVTFELYYINAEGTEVVYKTDTTDADGKITFRYLPVNQMFYLRETSGAAGYENTPIYRSFESDPEDAVTREYNAEEENYGIIFTSKTATAEITYKNDPVTTTIEFLKKNDKGGNVNGAMFKLIGIEDDEGVTTVYSDTATSIGGVVTFENVPWGTYKLMETSAPSGYTPDDTEYTMVIDPDGSYVIYRYDDAARVSVYDSKEDEEKWVVVNVYGASGSITLKGTKELTGRTLDEGEFEFILKDSEDKEIETVSNLADGTFAFTKITYIEEGIYTYTVSEAVAAAPLGGVTYDRTVYTVTVTVKDNRDGTLEATAVYETGNNPAEAIKFENVYEASGSVTLMAAKKLDGRLMSKDEFSFNLTETTTGSTYTETVQNDGSGNVEFTEIGYDLDDVGEHTYTIKEVGGGTFANGVDYDDTFYTVKVVVKNNSDGTLTATETYYDSEGNKIEPKDTVFTNTYEAAPVFVTLAGTKDLDGRDLKDKEFEFVLTETTEDRTYTETVNNQVSGSYAFSELTFDTAGKYTYTVSEVVPATPLGGVTYDTKVYTVTITVTDDGKGSLGVSVEVVDSDENEGNPEELDFTNGYEASGSIVLNGMKELDGRDWSATDEFRFVLTDITTIDSTYTETVSNDENGNIVFSKIEYNLDDVGTHRYTIKEEGGGSRIAGVTYDNTVKTVEVYVTDNGDGTLNVAEEYPEDGLTFTNIYSADSVDLSLTGTKKLTNKTLTNKTLEADMFSFVVEEEAPNGEEKVVATGTNDADGKITFSKITYTAAGEHTYTITEVNGGAGGIGYDSTEHTVKVYVTDNQEGKLKAKVEYPEDGVVFNNTYTAESTTVSLTGTKELTDNSLTNKTLEGGEFGFVVKDQNGDIVAAGTNDADGLITFSEFGVHDENNRFTAPGIYTYTVSEIQNQEAAWFIYDSSIYTVTVEVTDDGTGKLKTEVKTKKDGEAADDILFANIYQPQSTSVEFYAEKILLGRDLEAGEFQFELKEDGTVLDTVSNDEDGLVIFPEITYDKIGTYVYTINETQGSLKKVVYDESIITVTVEVTNEDHTLQAIVTYTKDEEEQEAIFINKYKPTVLDEEYYNDLEVLKSVDKTEAKPGETITYTITAENSGTVEKDDLVIKDHLPEYTTFVSSPDGTLMKDNKGEYVEWTIDSLAAGEKVEFTFTVKVTGAAPNGHKIKNAAIYGDEKTTDTVTTVVKSAQADSTVTPTPKPKNTGKTGITKAGTTKTGDTTQWLLWILCAAASVGGVLALLRKRRGSSR